MPATGSRTAVSINPRAYADTFRDCNDRESASRERWRNVAAELSNLMTDRGPQCDCSVRAGNPARRVKHKQSIVLRCVGRRPITAWLTSVKATNYARRKIAQGERSPK